MSAFAVLPVLASCAPKVSAGEWQCPAADGGADGGPSEPAQETDPIRVPWSTGFEDGFCDYLKVAGTCYGDAPYIVVTEPRHSGKFSAKMAAIGSLPGSLPQTRCIRRGELPESAYYSAWYYIPEPLTKVKSAWNLWHFAGGDSPDDALASLWDVTLVRGVQDGEWELVVYDIAGGGGTYRGPDHKPVPIGSWFKIVLFLKRAPDASGEIRLYQDDSLLFEQTKLKSDFSKYGQWYVGDWTGDDAEPEDSYLYVDDVSISASLSATQ